MTLIFNIEYRTSWGEEVRVLGSIPELGNNQPNKATPLHTVDGIHWTAEVDIQIPGNGSVEYSYHIYRDGRTIRTEWNSLPRILHVADNPKKVYRIEDCWKNLPEQQYFYTSAFTESLLAHRERSAAPKSYKKGLLIKAYAPCIDSDHCLALCGNQKALGDWNPDKAALMSDIDFPEWQVEVDAGKISFPLEYKFVLYNKKERRAVAWENNPNRYMADPQIAANETLAVGDRYVYFNLPAWKGSGVAVPVFSLRSEKSFGVGDFGDLKRMIDWAVATNQKAVQILPINDTTMTHTWTDSYPYSSISIYAFHPMYADLKQLGSLKDKKVMAEFNKRQKELNALPAVDYEAVNKTKWEYFHLIFKQEGEKVLASDAFRNFYEANKEWLQPYAVFSYLRDAYKTPNFREWPKYATYDAKEIETLCRPDSADYPHIAIYYYIQFNLHLQLLAATEHARANGVVLKGDIPIGISRNSVEAWKEPHYFNLNGQAGAPPDDFIRLPEGEKLPEKITELTGITDEMLEKEGLDENDAVYDFEELLDDTAGPVLLAAHNAQFDLQFAGTMAERYAQPCAELLARADYLDTLTVYKDRRPYPHKLANAIAAYKLEDKVQNSHRAIDDVAALFEVCRAMDDERADLLEYVNIFGYNPKYGVAGRRLAGVTYWPQRFNKFMQSPSYTLPALAKGGRNNA